MTYDRQLRELTNTAVLSSHLNLQETMEAILKSSLQTPMRTSTRYQYQITRKICNEDH